ncbi:O-antigen ligase family protein [Sphingomonas qilianensis]|uniref:O-antigen ligase family protein n=1 Tax=Sphingomonas qilianensis TaxID=1736690 RepID=UPI00360E0182
MLTYLLFCAALLMGGASQGGIYGNAAIQMMAAVAIAAALVTRTDATEGPPRRVLWLLIAASGLAIVQLLPLPPEIWTNLPGRRLAIETLRLAGIAPGWRPFSLAPAATLGAALALLPAIAALLIGMRAPRQQLIALYATITAIMMLSVMLGLTQRATGLDSALYLYAVTNRGLAVGFFANSNHLATLCALSIPIATAWLVARRGGGRTNGAWLLLVPIVLFALLGVAFTSSIAGLGLSLIGLVSIYAISRWRRGASKRGAFAILAIAAAVLGAGVVLVASQTGGAGGDGMGRLVLWERTLRAIGDSAPWGTGLGSFAVVYPAYENPMTVTNVFANHAHNDYLETLLGGGAPALILMLAFAYWWMRTTIGVWTAPVRDALAEAATVVTAIVLLHEIVDYPLRTAAIGVVFGLCCGIMARPNRVTEPRDNGSDTRASRHVSA